MNLNIHNIEDTCDCRRKKRDQDVTEVYNTQPFLRQTLKKVDAELGVTVFTRVKGHLKLTPEDNFLSTQNTTSWISFRVWTSKSNL